MIWNGAEIGRQEDSMKNTLCRITGILALAFLATTEVARAQEPVVANIPFQFTAGVMTHAASINAPQAKSKLVFHRYGNRYFLTQVWSAGSSLGRELPKSAKEKEQALAAHNHASDQVTIVARLVTSNH